VKKKERDTKEKIILSPETHGGKRNKDSKLNVS
jgi:hypothetical protein